MRANSYAGYRLTARRPASSAAVEHWWAEGPDGPAEVFLGPEMLVRRARALPVWGPFADILTGREGLRSYVVVRGQLGRNVDDMRRMLSPGACVAFAWHLAAALAEVHERGGAHGALHPGWTGVDTEGRLTIRPALTAAVRSDPDGEASAQASDCIQLASILDALELERVDEPALTLLMRGVSRDRARLRLQPGRAVRQSLSYILGRHPEWEASLVDTLGEDWSTTLIPRSVVLPKPVPSHPWTEHGTHIPRVGGPPVASATATVDLRAAAPSSPPPVTTSSARSSSPGAPAAVVPAAVAGAAVVPASVAPAPVTATVSPARPAPPSDLPPEPEGLQVRLSPAPPSTPAPEPSAAVSELPAPDSRVPDAAVQPPEPASVEPPTEVPPDVPLDVSPEPDPTAPPLVADVPDPASEPSARTPEVPPVVESPTDITPSSPALAALLADMDAGPPDEPADDPELETVPAMPVVLASELPTDDPSSEDEYFEDDEKTAVTSVPEPVKQALARMDAERNLRDLVRDGPSLDAVPASVPEPITDRGPAPTLVPPSDTPMPAVDAALSGDDTEAPRWAGLKGVTGDASREDELGSGKWEEEARPLDELRKEMGATPVRPMEDIDPSRGNWTMLAVAVAALVCLVALWFATQGNV